MDRINWDRRGRINHEEQSSKHENYHAIKLQNSIIISRLDELRVNRASIDQIITDFLDREFLRIVVRERELDSMEVNRARVCIDII